MQRHWHCEHKILAKIDHVGLFVELDDDLIAMLESDTVQLLKPPRSTVKEPVQNLHKDLVNVKSVSEQLVAMQAMLLVRNAEQRGSSWRSHTS